MPVVAVTAAVVVDSWLLKVSVVAVVVDSWLLKVPVVAVAAAVVVYSW